MLAQGIIHLRSCSIHAAVLRTVSVCCLHVLCPQTQSSFLFFFKFGPLFECVCVCVLPVCGPPGATATRSASSLSPVVSCAHTWGANPATYRLRGAHGWWALFCRLRGFCYSPFLSPLLALPRWYPGTTLAAKVPLAVNWKSELQQGRVCTPQSSLLFRP